VHFCTGAADEYGSVAASAGDVYTSSWRKHRGCTDSCCCRHC